MRDTFVAPLPGAKRRFVGPGATMSPLFPRWNVKHPTTWTKHLPDALPLCTTILVTHWALFKKFVALFKHAKNQGLCIDQDSVTY
jgi:hypothetical protein